MGIGLAIAREVVQAHGGEIGVDPRPGGGSSFWFRLPLGVAHITVDEIELTPAKTIGTRISPPDAESDTPASAEGSPYTLLLVEDNRDMRYFLRIHLEAHYRVIEKVDGLSALQWLERNRPDLIVADVMMPQMDGITLCREVRRRYARQALPVLLLSAKRTSFDRTVGLEAGANDYLGKPFEIKELLLRLQSLRPAQSAIKELKEGAKDWQQLAEQVMEAHLDNAEFTVGAMAKALGTSERQLQRLCYQYFDASPSACLRHFRLERAREMLEQARFPNLSLTAQAVGMSPHYFTRLYKNHFGQSARDVLATSTVNS
jgi:DNA-binding response OmpR family regulator